MKLMLARLFALTLLAALLVPSVARAGDARPAPDSGHLIVILGASTASGVGAKPISQSFARRYTDYVGKLSPAHRVVNLAVSGYNTFQMLPDGKTPLKRFHPDTEHNITKALSLHPETVILVMSTNDAAGRLPLADVEQNILTIAEEAWRARVKFWITTPPPRNLDAEGRKYLADLAAWVRQQFGRTAIDFTTGMTAPDGTMLPRFDSGDGIHPNNDGHAFLLERLLAAPIVYR